MCVCVFIFTSILVANCIRALKQIQTLVRIPHDRTHVRMMVVSQCLAPLMNFAFPWKDVLSDSGLWHLACWRASVGEVGFGQALVSNFSSSRWSAMDEDPSKLPPELRKLLNRCCSSGVLKFYWDSCWKSDQTLTRRCDMLGNKLAIWRIRRWRVDSLTSAKALCWH